MIRKEEVICAGQKWSEGIEASKELFRVKTDNKKLWEYYPFTNPTSDRLKAEFDITFYPPKHKSSKRACFTHHFLLYLS